MISSCNHLTVRHMHAVPASSYGEMYHGCLQRVVCITRDVWLQSFRVCFRLCLSVHVCVYLFCTMDDDGNETCAHRTSVVFSVTA